MKKLLVCIGFFLLGMTASAQDPILDVIKAGIKKAIIAVDLKIQRLQTKTIWLQNAQKVIENAMSELKLGQITDWVQKQKDLYQDYFDELWKVKDVLSYYHRIKEITQQEVSLVKQYHSAWNGVRQDGHFTANELLYIGQVYTGILAESVKNLDQLALVINSFTTQMTDAKRLEIINKAADGMQQNYDDLVQFNSRNIGISLQRSRDENDINVVKLLYGIQ
ncbi:conjugal transfer protein TraI [Ginsengibacter hankyongi]|uniref:Conjugal transfer protein TraI n=1 Tax=Ginsengibacter hankyongi TaxID=2607284 RepID=A0A5J5IF97_9BACT|nr:conjugal transfer protein TraI [Ginsengibacter hankyongi]KAA9038698.1 conjugal transfer protein TraI [Ginsengibacter hankyongi]